MAKLSVSVMAHPQRKALVPELANRLGIDGSRVVWDRKNERWDTGRRAWEIYDPKADYHMVIQDDAVVVRDLVPGLEKALDFVPDNATVCPFVGTRRPMRGRVEQLVTLAQRTNASWIEFPSLFWGVAIIVPTHVIDDMLLFGDRITAYPNYDKRIGQYFVQRLHWPTWCTWPNLVDHRDVDSLVGHGSGRVAHNFAGENVSALDLDYGKGCIPMNSVPGMVRRRNVAFRRATPIRGTGGERQEPRGTSADEHAARLRKRYRRF